MHCERVMKIRQHCFSSVLSFHEEKFHQLETLITNLPGVYMRFMIQVSNPS